MDKKTKGIIWIIVLSGVFLVAMALGISTL